MLRGSGGGRAGGRARAEAVAALAPTECRAPCVRSPAGRPPMAAACGLAEQRKPAACRTALLRILLERVAPVRSPHGPAGRSWGSSHKLGCTVPGRPTCDAYTARGTNPALGCYNSVDVGEPEFQA